MRIETATNDRKAMVRTISGFVGEDSRYVGPPTFAYTVGNLVIDRNGVITSESEEGAAELRAFLEENGYAEPEIEYMDVVLPTEGMDGLQLKNLVFMLHSKQYLLNRSLGAANFTISEDLVKALKNSPPETKEAFLDLFWANVGGTRGISFSADEAVFIFPYTEDSSRSLACTDLAARMLAKAKEAKRISPDLQEPENEKYYFRIWLIQLGLGGADAKETRRSLMSGLKGYAAFRTEEEAEKFKADQKEKRAAKKAAASALEDD